MKNTTLKSYLIGFLAFLAFTVHSQNVGINTTAANPAASAILDLSTGNTGHAGFLAPQVALLSNTDIVTIPAPAAGLIIYNTAAGVANGVGYYYWTGAPLNIWAPIAGAAGNWLLTGNLNTSPATNWLGTNDAQAFQIRVDGQESGWLDYLAANGNAFWGYQAGKVNTGQFNAALGYQALAANTSGSNNTALGYGTLNTNIAGSENTAVGYDALFHNTASSNTAMGYYALTTNVSGIDNVAIGQQAAWVATGNYTTALGAFALFNTGNVNFNVGIGYQAGLANTLGGLNTFIGTNTNASANNFNNSTAIGFAAEVGASNVLVLGAINGVNGSGADVFTGIGTIAPTQKLQVANGNVLNSNTTATAGQIQFQGTGAGISTFQADAQGATNYNYTMPIVAPTVTYLLEAQTYVAPNVQLGYNQQPSGVLIGLIVVTANTAATPLAAGTTFIVYKIIGGGAAGGGVKFTTTGGCVASTGSAAEMAGAGGGAGGYSEGQITGINGALSTYAVTIGAGGIGQPNCGAPAAGNGGNTILTLTNPAIVLTAPGGLCGGTIEEKHSNNTFYNLLGGIGGTPINAGAYNVTGGSGGFASIDQAGVHSAQSGPGGSSIFGGAASGFVMRSTLLRNGNPANNYGSGGGGAVAPDCNTLNASASGGNGFQGIVIIYEYQ